MENSNRNKIIIGLIVLAVLAGGIWWFKGGSTFQHRLASGESVSAWTFKGTYSGNAQLEGRARAEITRLEALIGKGPETDYSYYVSIANQYNLLGDGAGEYEYLKKALAIDAEHTGLAWNNLGALFARLGAKATARDAYARAVKAQDQFIQYHMAYLEYLTKQFPEDTGAIERGFEATKPIFGDNASVLEIHARWLESVGKIEEAIQDWQKIKELSPGAASAVDVEIRRLRVEL